MYKSGTPKTDVQEFQRLLQRSDRVLALCGAGLSVSSGLPTFRGARGLWRNHQATELATADAFQADPALVWLFYAWRRHMALKVKPNQGHYALAELARRRPNFLCLTQNVDGLSTRAGHPASRLRMLHGNLLDMKCSGKCGYIEPNVLRDPLCPALASAAEDYRPDQTMPLLDPDIPPPKIDLQELPHCPRCQQSGQRSLMRPGVVWFGEALPDGMVDEVDAWVDKGKIDVMLVIGTAAVVYPAAGYTAKAREMGAIVAVINPDPSAAAGLGGEDFFFRADAAELLPRLLYEVIGELHGAGEAE